VIGLIAAVLIGGWYVLSRPGRVVDVRGSQFGSSLAREHQGRGGGGCTQQEDRDWFWCGVENDPESGFGSSYRLTTEDDGCWEAEPARAVDLKGNPGRGTGKLVRVARVSGGPLTGCVGLLDYVWPDHAAGGGGAGELALPSK